MYPRSASFFWDFRLGLYGVAKVRVNTRIISPSEAIFYEAK
jgi:hypothetical protein